MGKLLHPCELPCLSHLQCRSAVAPVLRDRDKSEGAGRRLFRFQRGIERKEIFWRRLLLSFSFKVLTKKEDGVNSSRLSSGNPAALCGRRREWGNKGRGRGKHRPSQLHDGAGIIADRQLTQAENGNAAARAERSA